MSKRALTSYIPSYFHLIPAPKVLDKNWTSFIDNILGSSINNVSSGGDGGGGVKNVGIYLVKRRQREREGVIKSEKWADVVYGWP